MLAYRDAAIGTVVTGDDIQQLRDRLFTTYVRTMLTRRRSDQHSARQTVRRLAFLAERMQYASQTVFTLELLDKYATPTRYWFDYNSLTARLIWKWHALPLIRMGPESSLVCGLASGLVLGVAGLVAYGWPSGMVGAVIGAAVGLPSFDRIGSSNFRYQRTLNQERQGETPRNLIDWAFDVPSYGFRNLLSTPGALGVAGCGAVAGLILGWPAGLFSSVVYGVATAVAVLTAAILCSGYSDGIQDWKPVAPGEGSGEIPSPIARAILRSGLPAALMVTLVTPILPGLLVAWPGTGADGVRFAAVVAVGAAMLALMWLGGFGVVEQAMVRRELRKLDLAPLPLRPFLDYATQCLFLRQVGDSYLFVHLSLLEFFAGMWELDDVPRERLNALVPG